MANPSRSGVLPWQTLHKMISKGQIRSRNKIPDANIQPASLDLRLGNQIYVLRASFLPVPGVRIQDRIKELALETIPMKGNPVLIPGNIYLCPLQESLDLPRSIWGRCNPRSTTGRLDLFARILAEEASGFDLVPKGYKGPLYAELCPQTFPIQVHKGSRVSQIRFCQGDPEEGQKVEDFSADLVDNKISVYQARKDNPLPVDMDGKHLYEIDDYWIPIFPRKGKLILEPNEFYILASEEVFKVQPNQAAEMRATIPSLGEFRVHYAGFFDPGFHAKAVLEVRCHEIPFLLEHKQVLGRLQYENMLEAPEIVYGTQIGSSYQHQELQLAKQFKPPAP